MDHLVVADRPVVASALAASLREQAGASVVMTTVDECLRAAHAAAPAVVVVDVEQVVADKTLLCRRLHDAGARTVFLAKGPDDALELLVQRADGVVTYDDGLAGVAAAVQSVVQGHHHVPPALLGGVLHGLISPSGAASAGDSVSDAIDRLSAREREVLSLLRTGLDHVQIARSMGISPQTARTHIRHVLGKLGVHSRVEAVALTSEQ